MRRDRLDGIGFSALLAVSLLLAANQIIIKEVNSGLQPVFFAGARSALAVVFVWLWLKYRGLLPKFRRADLAPGLLIGTMFAGEFLCLFMALDLTSVGHASLIMYSMPLWMAILAHFFLPGEGMTPLRSLGLVLAFLGTGWAILSKTGAGTGAGTATLTGDLFALGAAWGWTGTAFLARVTRLREAGPEVQLFWMVLISAPILLLAAPFFGPLAARGSADPLVLAGLSSLGRRRRWVHFLALAAVGLPHRHRRQLFLPVAGVCHFTGRPDLW